MTRIGVLALQGDVSEHITALRKAAADSVVIEVRAPGQIEECQALVIPGGESTTIRRQMDSSGITGELVAAARSGKPGRFKPLGLMDIKVSRNAFGPQKESFEADLDVRGLDRPYRAVFIRAPVIAEAGGDVEVLARLDEGVVAAREKNLLALAFHPELTDDSRIHQIFLNMLED
ncbi:MAG: glutamine amidotransferase [Methanosaeta sp. NSM2]|nr:pyridoxal 5'-phosphate synthase glutaminase subunit PdxT [Methanothrix sp.]OYV13055.1 MAG: glutamine amidotransferase [Methanosaeta sp. NSM2]